jgi:hypothetical protein
MTTCARLVASTLVACVCVTTPAAARRKPITVRVPKFQVPADTDREVCTFLRVPLEEGIDLKGFVVRSATNEKLGSTSHHFLLWVYTGSNIDGFSDVEGKLVDGNTCNNVGPADAISRILLVGAQTPKSVARLRKGLALRVEPQTDAQGRRVVGLLLNSHWINFGTRTVTGAVRVKLLPANPRTVKQHLKPIFEVTGNAFIDVPPRSRGTAGWQWGPGQPDLSGGIGMPPPTGPACVYALTGHIHSWGTRFVAEHVVADDTRSELYAFTDYVHPGQRLFGDGLLVRPGERIEYTCSFDNGLDRPVKLGCEETPGVPPGLSIIESMALGRGPAEAAAKRCSTLGDAPAECPAADPAHPGRTFTGRCVEANLVFGFTSVDEMCLLAGTYYDADPVAPPGQECEL